MDQYFYFQDFEYDGSDGATSNTVWSGSISHFSMKKIG